MSIVSQTAGIIVDAVKTMGSATKTVGSVGLKALSDAYKALNQLSKDIPKFYAGAEEAKAFNTMSQVANNVGLEGEQRAVFLASALHYKIYDVDKLRQLAKQIKDENLSGKQIVELAEQMAK